jgi:hypothetical protein
MVIEHLRHEVDSAVKSKEMATLLKEGKKIVEDKKLAPDLTPAQREWQQALIHRQRAILNQKIYGIQARSAPN